MAFPIDIPAITIRSIRESFAKTHPEITGESLDQAQRALDLMIEARLTADACAANELYDQAEVVLGTDSGITPQLMQQFLYEELNPQGLG
jgi:hypothetical protein